MSADGVQIDRSEVGPSAERLTTDADSVTDAGDSSEVMPHGSRGRSRMNPNTEWSRCVPLSDDEQRILFEIEKEFYDSDPEFAREVSETSLYRHALRNIKWAVLIGVLGLVGLIAALQVHFLLAFGASMVMFASAVVIERNLRNMGRAGLQQVSGAVRNRQGPGISGMGGRLKDRFKRDD